jgi:hypothetical protein
MKTWGSGGIAPAFLTSALDEGEWSASRPGPREKTYGTHWVGSLVGPRAGLDAMDKRQILHRRPVRSPALPTELSRLLYVISTGRNVDNNYFTNHIVSQLLHFLSYLILWSSGCDTVQSGIRVKGDNANYLTTNQAYFNEQSGYNTVSLERYISATFLSKKRGCNVIQNLTREL